MKICLIGAPAVTDFDDREMAESESVRLVAHQAPLGVLTLAGLARDAGYGVEVVDLDALYYEYLRAPRRSRGRSFTEYAAANIEARDFDLAGFGTLCSSFPITLRIAESVDRRCPERTLVLGGPQASVVDRPTLEAFPWIDFIVRGEADRSFLEFLAAHGEETPQYAEVPGLSYRCDGQVVQTAKAPLVDDLDSLPLPAFDLYPQAAGGAHLPLELGRGCPYACKFCATNDFFRRNFRLKSAAKMLEQMRTLHQTYGVDSFSLVHDMFTVDRRKVLEFCATLSAAEEDFYWSCSARTDRVDDELLGAMYEAGCRGIFFGIETGSKVLQKTIQKNLDLDQAVVHIRAADDHGIETEVSLISGFAEETRDDLGDTLGFFMESMRLRHTDGNIGLLAPLAATPIEKIHREELIFDDYHSDVSFQGWRQNEADRRMILEHREIFPNFYAVPMRHLERRYVYEVRELAVRGMSWFRRLLVALYHDSDDMLSVIDRWLAWRDAPERLAEGADGTVELGPTPQGPAPHGHAPYYVQPRFRDDFLHFLEQSYIPERAAAKDILHALVDYERLFRMANPDPSQLDPSHLDPSQIIPTQGSAGSAAGCPNPALSGTDATGGTGASEDSAAVSVEHRGRRPSWRAADIPQVDPGVRFMTFPVSFDALETALRDGQDLRDLPRQEVVLAAAPASRQVHQLSPGLGDLLSACDGHSTVESLAAGLAGPHGSGEGIDDVTPIHACRYGLDTLWKQGFLRITSSPELSRDPSPRRRTHADDLQQLSAQ